MELARGRPLPDILAGMKMVAEGVRTTEAALACLEDAGLLRFTTTDVCARAELSQGALFRYFPSKASLLAAGLVVGLAKAFF